MLYWDDAATVNILKEILKRDEIIVASGDTVLGLWGNLTQAAFEKINQIKHRFDNKPYLITIASAQKLSKFIDQEIPENVQNLIETCWPGPVTLVFQARKNLPSWMLSEQGTIALRVPDHDELLDLLRNFDGLFSTSANIHGQTIPNCIDQIHPDIVRQVRAICAQRDQQCFSQSPSTILDCSSGTIKVLRLGAVGMQELKEFLP